MGIRVQAKHPGPRARDPYLWEVFISDEDLPWPLVLRFACDVDPATPSSTAWVVVGLELRRNLEQVDDKTELSELAAIGPEHLVALAAKLDSYRAIAIGYLEFDAEAARRAAWNLYAARSGRGRRRLDDDFLREIAGEYKRLVTGGRPGVGGLAQAHDVDKSTASRWVKKALRRGLLEPEED